MVWKCATFPKVSPFENAAFSERCVELWKRPTFSGGTSFEKHRFFPWRSSESTTFSGTTGFGGATFQNSTNYREAKFEKRATFAGIKVDRAFDMTGATFKQVPAFNQADFKQAPDLDDVRFPLPFFWQGDAELIARYRAIRRMAIQGADYEREQMAFKGELRSRRWTTDKWWHFGTWFGLLYDGLADCGRSIVRPLLLWQASVVVFAILYTRLADQARRLRAAARPSSRRCSCRAATRWCCSAAGATRGSRRPIDASMAAMASRKSPTA